MSPTLRRRSLTAFACAAALVTILSACTSKKSSASTDLSALPAASDLMSQAETAMGTVQTVHFAINVSGSLPGLPLRSADGTLTRSGDAKGKASITEFGATVEASFVIVGSSFYLNAGTGGYQQLPLSEASSIYDPSAILDPNRGVVKLLATATGPKTEARESVNGTDAYRVALTPDPAAVNILIPGSGAGTTGKIWIDAATHRVVKGVFVIPATGSGSPATVTITLDDFDAPANITAP